MGIKHYNIRVSGKVQGVFFRASTQSKAEELGLTGYCRNELNGDVYIEVEGDEVSIQQLISWCHKGPPNAVVAGVQVERSTVKNFQEFIISRSYGDDPYA